MSLTTILLTVSVACNVWFVFLLMYDRIMETKLFRFFGKLAGIWKSLHAEEKDSSPEADASAIATAPEIIGKSRFRMTVTRTMTTVPKPQAATSDKGEEVQSDDVTFADEAERKTARVPKRSSTKYSATYLLKRLSTAKRNRKRKPRTDVSFRQQL